MRDGGVQLGKKHIERKIQRKFEIEIRLTDNGLKS
jgi:hypothetical protein